MSALHKLIFSFFLLTSLISLNSCSLIGATPQLRSELANQGPIGLSESNPYISGNLLLAKEMQNSSVFKGFIENKGTPDAIEVKKLMLGSDQMTLYYLSDSEYYSFVESTTNNWLIKGPFKISSDMLTTLANLEVLKGPAPLVHMDGDTISETENLNTAADLPELKRVKPENINSKMIPARAALKKDIKPEKTVKDKAAWAKETGGETAAEESIAGDVIHKVSFEDEDLKTLAKWYTGDSSNAGRIARINGIDVDAALNKDQTIRVPRYLIKNTNPLPESEIKKKKDIK